jgi:prepilin-type N-terminal cleavage/methylation domain-containing protein/prepilin-type processing-associated H-X9-DG protein
LHFQPKYSGDGPVLDAGRVNQSPQAFTLIELLVVIAIIAVLAALVFPAINGALETSRRAGCAANLKTLATAVLTYAPENNGALPSVVGNPNGIGSWFEAALNLTNKSVSSGKGPSCLYCPSAKWPVQRNGVKVDFPYDTSYGINAPLVGSTSGTNSAGKAAKPTRLAMLPKPSTIVLLADGASYDEDNGHAWAIVNGGTNAPNNYISKNKHKGGANVAWCDGHVTFESSKSVALLMDATNWTHWIPSQNYQPWQP